MTLLSSFKSVLNGFVKRGAFVPQQTLLREIHSTPCLCRKKTVEEKLGLPSKPKLPLSGYTRFITENIASVNAKNPNLLKKEQFSLLAKMWNKIGDARKQEYLKLCAVEKLEYRAKLIEYKRTLSDDDQKRIQELKAAILARKAKIIKTKQRYELGMPKKPLNKFLKFFAEQRKQIPKENRNYYLEIANMWRGLSDAERAKYQTSSAESEAYKKAMYEWEADMISKGRSDIIRVSTVVPKLAKQSGKVK